MSKMLMYVGIFFMLVFGWYGIKKGIFLWFMSHYEPPPITISATHAINKDWQSYVTAVGTLTAVNGVDISSEAAGVIEKIHFSSGEVIKKDAPIVKIKANVEQANLKSYQAKYQLAKLNYEREQRLFARKVISQAILDKYQAELLEAQAGVESVQAQIKQKTITAPFDGRLGIRQINLGQYVSPGTPIVTLQSLNPLFIVFNLPEQYLPELSLGQAVDVTINIENGKSVQGKINAINAKVDPHTRNVLVQAIIQNENYQFYPGMYGFVKIWLKLKKQAVVIPQTAISYSLSGDYVFLIKNEDKNGQLLKAYRQYVKVGERRDDEVEIRHGLKAGDSIVTSGQLKLSNASPILIDNSVVL